MKRVLAAVALLGVAAAPAPAVHVWGVAELSEQILDQDHKIIQVRGWVSGCTSKLSHLSECSLASELGSENAAFLDLNAAPSVAPALKKGSGHEVVLRARVIADCNAPAGPACRGEGASELAVLGVVKVFPKAP